MHTLKQIRHQIGENQLGEALQLLIEYLDSGTDADLQDQAILQKSRWNDYQHKKMGGFADEKEVNAIRSALLEITRMAEKRKEKPHEVPFTPAPMEAPPAPGKLYVAQCFFTGDPNSYYVLPNNQIVVINMMTNMPVHVANRNISIMPNFAWVYQFPNGFFYSVDHAGIIWGLNAFGMSVQMGYVKYL